MGEATGTAVQVVKFNEYNRLVLDEEALGSILMENNVKDKPVVVISIAGAYRTGKSFLLNFLIRYLKAQGAPDWIGASDEALGGFHWRNSTDMQTKGIWLWSKAFLMDAHPGGQVAVILMDTQGTFDDNSTMNESTTIFALSTLISSVQIYNISNNIQEDDLKNLQIFIEYGRLALQNSTEKPFQKLMFLVRDWMAPDAFSFGAGGGESFLTRKLQVTDKQRPELREVREHIRACFQYIACFLMPYPGEHVAESSTFDGRLEDIRERFVDMLQNLVTQLLGAENLIVKQIGTQAVKSEDVFNYFKSVANLFAEGNISEVTGIYQATVEQSHQSIKSAAKDCYVSRMQHLVTDDEEKLVQGNEDAKLEAVVFFNDHPKYGGGPEYTERFRALLETEIDQEYFEIKRRWLMAMSPERFEGAMGCSTSNASNSNSSIWSVFSGSTAAKTLPTRYQLLTKNLNDATTFGIRDMHAIAKSEKTVLRIDRAHKNSPFDHININSKVTKLPDPHIPLPAGSAEIGNVVTKSVDALGTAALVAAVAADTCRVGSAVYKDITEQKSLGFETAKSAASVSAGWAGGFAGAAAGNAVGSVIGGAIGTAFGGVGAIPGAAIGSIVGGAVSGVACGMCSSVAAEKISDAVRKLKGAVTSEANCIIVEPSFALISEELSKMWDAILLDLLLFAYGNRRNEVSRASIITRQVADEVFSPDLLCDLQEVSKTDKMYVYSAKLTSSILRDVCKTPQFLFSALAIAQQPLETSDFEKLWSSAAGQIPTVEGEYVCMNSVGTTLYWFNPGQGVEYSLNGLIQKKLFYKRKITKK